MQYYHHPRGSSPLPPANSGVPPWPAKSMEIRCKSISGGIQATPGARNAHIGPKCTKMDGKWSQNDASGPSRSHPLTRSGTKCPHIESTHYLQHFRHISYARNYRFPTHLAPHFPSFPNMFLKLHLGPFTDQLFEDLGALIPSIWAPKGALGLQNAFKNRSKNDA